MDIIDSSGSVQTIGIVRPSSIPDRLYLIFAGTAISMTCDDARNLAECIQSVASQQIQPFAHKIIKNNHDIVCERTE